METKCCRYFPVNVGCLNELKKKQLCQFVTELSFNQIRLQAIRAAQNLRKIGVQPHQMFAFIANSFDEMVLILFAAICLACPLIAIGQNTFEPRYCQGFERNETKYDIL